MQTSRVKMDLSDQAQTDFPPLQDSEMHEPSKPKIDWIAKAASDLMTIATDLLENRYDLSQSKHECSNFEATADKMIRARLETDLILKDVSASNGPALDILLELFVNQSREQVVSITEATLAGRFSPTTGLRWVKILIDSGLIIKKDDPSDRRRSFVFLTKEGQDVVENCILAHSIL